MAGLGRVGVGVRVGVRVRAAVGVRGRVRVARWRAVVASPAPRCHRKTRTWIG